MNTFFAHSTNSKDKSDWQLLEDHLYNVAKLCRNFGEVFESSAWTLTAGILLCYAIAGHHGGLPDGGEQRGLAWYGGESL